jgi:predicted PurR-regulated permease PerM
MAEQEKAAGLIRRGALLMIGAMSVALLAYLLFALRNVMLVVVLAGFWAYFLAWPAKALSRWMPTRVAVHLSFYISFLLILGLLGPIGGVLFTQANEFIKQIPEMALRLEQSISSLSIELLPGQTLQFDQSITDALEQLRQNAPTILSRAINTGQSVISGTAEVLLALIVIPLMALYMLLDSDRLRRAVLDVFPARMRDDVARVMTSINRSLGSYIYNRVILALFASLAMFAVLLILKVPFPVILGLLAFISEFVPVIGAWVALVPILLIALATKPAWVVVTLLIAFGVIQLLQSYVLTPKLMSESMDMHPLTVVIAMLIGGSIGGFAGLLLAIPLAAILKVIVNVFVFRREEKGMHVPALDLIGAGNPPGGGDLDYRVQTPENPQPAPDEQS